MTDSELIARFKRDPETAYRQLLERYSPVILRMIRRFMYDDDEVMEVYTSVCERLRAKDFRLRFGVHRSVLHGPSLFFQQSPQLSPLKVH